MALSRIALLMLCSFLVVLTVSWAENVRMVYLILIRLMTLYLLSNDVIKYNYVAAMRCFTIKHYRGRKCLFGFLVGGK